MPDTLIRLCESVSDAIIGLDDDGMICLCNPTAERIFGVEAQAVTGRAPADEPTLRPLLPLIARGSEATAREELVLPSGGVYWAQLLHLPEIPHLLILRQTDGPTEATTALTSQMRHIVHDLKQPIAAVKGFVELIQEAGKEAGNLNAIQIDFTNRALTRLAHMLVMVNELLDVMWLESGRQLDCSTVDLTRLTRDAISDFELSVQSQGITFEINAPDAPCRVYGDERRLASVLNNLLSNAIKYSPDGGPIRVRLQPDGQWIQMQIEDEGMGIAPEHLDHIFERFYRVRSEKTWRIDGTGLGLAIVEAIVEKHGGTIAVSSTLDVGTTFTVRLPLGAPCDE